MVIRKMDNKFESKHQIMGEAKDLEKELNVLNRIVRWGAAGIEIEADPKHVEIIVKELELTEAKPVATPAIRDPGAKGNRCSEDDEDDEACVDVPSTGGDGEMEKMIANVGEDFKGEEEIDPWYGQDEVRSARDKASGEKLGREAATAYRSIVARMNYMAMDRPDVQFAIKTCAKAMSSPGAEDWIKLKRIARYLLGRPAVAITFKLQAFPWRVRVYTDSDWAGDRVDRKSTTGGAIVLGGHLVKSWSKDQPIIALSSGEAELYAANFGAAQGLGLCSMARDLGVEMDLNILIDASAAMGIINRQGLGKVTLQPKICGCKAR